MTFFRAFLHSVHGRCGRDVPYPAWKWGVWLWRLPRADKMRIVRGLPTRRTAEAVWEVVSESLLHRRIFRVNPLLGYMHMSLAFGWFLLIAVGWVDRDGRLPRLPLRAVAGACLFSNTSPRGWSTSRHSTLRWTCCCCSSSPGVALAWAKRFRSRAMGLRRTTKTRAGRPCGAVGSGSSSRPVWRPKARPAPFTAAGDSSPDRSAPGWPIMSGCCRS